MNGETITQVITQENIPATMREAYNSLIENLNENTIPESDSAIEDDGDSISFDLSEEEQAILDQAVEDAHQEIPTNSATLLVDEATSRFSSAIWYEKIREKTIVLAGVGGIGRFGNLINF